MMKVTKIFIYFLIFSIIFNPFASAIIVDTNVFTPTDFATMQTVVASPIVLESKILVAGETSTMTTSLDNGKISISDSVHTFREVSMDYQMLLDELDGFNGEKIALTHVNDAGEIDYRRVVSVSPDVNGYVSVIMEFSTTIVDGFTGTTTTTLTGLSGNQSISVPDGSSYDINITNEHGDSYGNDKYINFSLNKSMVSGSNPNLPLRFFVNLPSGVLPNGSNVRIYYENGTEIPREIESYSNNNLSVFFKPDITENTTDITYQLWYGSTTATEPTPDSTYGSNNVWSGYTAVWLMNTDPTSEIKDSTGNGYNATVNGFVAGDLLNTSYGKELNFDSNYLEIGRVTALEGAAEDFTVGVYGRYDAAAPNAMTLWGYSTDDSPSSGEYLVYFSTIFGGIAWGSPYYDASMPDVLNNHLMTFGRTTNNFVAHLDGVNTLDTALNGYAGNSSYVFKFGDDYNNVYMNGKIEFAYIHPDDLSDDYQTTQFKVINNPTATGANSFYKSISTEQTPNLTVNITASVTGDNNTQSYNTSQSREFTLTPTGSTNNVLLNTTSTNYDVVITTYWTENTIKLSETVSNGYANITVQYTPSNNITAGVINATYNTIDFAAHDYTGTLSVLVDGVDYTSNGTRLLNDVNTTIVNFDTSTHYINFSVPYNPPLNLYSPNDTAALSYAYPPLTHDVVLSWEQSTGTYKYTVTDYDTGAVISSSTVSSNTTTVALSSGEYKWYINGYDGVFDEYSQSSAIRSFTVDDTYSYNGTVVHGVVYEYISGVQTPLNTALVNIWNNTWSSSSMTGTNGYFLFTGLHNSTYSMRATKDGYVDSNIELVTPTFNTTLTRDILMQDYTGAGREYVSHYVKFTVKSLLGTLYSGVDVNVYLDDAVISTYTGTTGDDGSVAFELNENQQYRITFIDASQGIDREITIYPVEDAYNVYVIANLFPTGGNIISEDISISIETATAGANAYINVTYTDNRSETTALYFYVNQTNIHDSQNQTLIASSGEIHATGFYSFTVTDYAGEAYLIHVHATHDTYGDIKETYSVRFEGLLDSFGWDSIWVWIAIGCITFTAFMFGAKNATQGSFVICVETWLFIAMDMFGDYNTIWFKAGVAMATLISILANMERHDSERS